jgi:hypothetical protein
VTITWPSADQRLERSYRRLLLAYPRQYRHRHGTEIVTTLLELAAPGQHRPDRAEAWHLLASGVRQRFRLPAGRPLALAFAVLMTLIGGALGAAAGSWSGVQTFADLPDGAALTQQAAGPGESESLVHDDSPWSAASVHGSTQVTGTWDIERSRQRLEAGGWDVDAVNSLDGTAAVYDPDTGTTIIPLHNGQFEARKNGVTMSVQASLTVDGGSVDVAAWADTTPALLPLILTGMVAGLLAGWLFAAAAAYRIVRSRRTVTTAILAGTAVAVLVLPAVALYGNLMRAFRYAGNTGPVFTVHNAFNPGPYYPFGPHWQVLALAIAGIVLVSVALLLARPGPHPLRQAA